MFIRIVLWSLAILLTGFPIWYLIAHWCNTSFRESAIGNWFGTVVGVIVGVPVALWLANTQRRYQDLAEKRARDQERQEQLSISTNYLYNELSKNEEVLARLQEVLSKPLNARTDVWRWAREVADSFEFSAYRQFWALLITPVERKSYALIDLAYLELKRFVSKVKEATAAHEFYYGYSADEKSANLQLIELRQYSEIIASNLKQATEALNRKDD